MGILSIKEMIAMSNELTTTSNNQAKAIEQVLAMGDLKQLTPEQRVMHYNGVCESLGLNPLTRPFEYIVLNGKLRLYTKKDATEQLRNIHNVSIEDMKTDITSDFVMVTVKVVNGKGRRDTDVGVVHCTGLKGEKKANTIMKAVTKAKRRATLSICGLGFTDESEVESIPNAVAVTVSDSGVIEGDFTTESEPQQKKPARAQQQRPEPSQGAGGEQIPAWQQGLDEHQIKIGLAGGNEFFPLCVKFIPRYGAESAAKATARILGITKLSKDGVDRVGQFTKIRRYAQLRDANLPQDLAVDVVDGVMEQADAFKANAERMGVKKGDPVQQANDALFDNDTLDALNAGAFAE